MHLAPGRGRAPRDDPGDAVAREGLPGPPDPQRRLRVAPAVRTGVQVAVEGAGGRLVEGGGPDAIALADDDNAAALMSTSPTRSEAHSVRRSRDDSSIRMIAMSRLSSSNRPRHAATRRSHSSSVRTCGGRSWTDGGLIRATGLTLISPSATNQPKMTLRYVRRRRAVSGEFRSASSRRNSRRCSVVMFAGSVGIPPGRGTPPGPRRRSRRP